MRTVALALLAMALANPAGAGLVRVPQDEPTIQAGLLAAHLGDTVLVACGTYLESDIVIDDNCVLLSETGDPDCAVIDASAVGRVLFAGEFVDSTTIIEGLTLTGGHAEGEGLDGGGGAILCQHASPTLRRCRLERNTAAGYGGALDAWYGHPQLSDCTFSENVAGWGGALAFEGLVDGDPVPRVNDCVLAGNLAQFGGGAVYCYDSSPALSACQITGNVAAGSQGGGIYARTQAGVRLTRCTVAGNWAQYAGGGLYLRNESSARLTQSVLWGDCGSDQGNEVFMYFSTACSLFVNCCDLDPLQIGGQGEIYWGEPSIAADPLFCFPEPCGLVPEGGGDYRLHAGSPCLPGVGTDCGLIGMYPVGCPATGVDTMSEFQRCNLRVSPNPFTARVVFAGPRSSPIDLQICDAAGRRVARLAPEAHEAGQSLVWIWNGRNNSGAALPSGTYFAKISSGERVESVRVVLAK